VQVSVAGVFFCEIFVLFQGIAGSILPVCALMRLDLHGNMRYLLGHEAAGTKRYALIAGRYNVSLGYKPGDWK
jgi:hypothetical protein